MEELNFNKRKQIEPDAKQLDIDFDIDRIHRYDIETSTPPKVDDFNLEIIGEGEEENDSVEEGKIDNGEIIDIYQNINDKTKKIIDLNEIKRRVAEKKKINNPRYNWQDRKDLE